MNILIASSRGGGLDRHVESHIHVESYVYPGANIDRLTQIVKHKIPPPYLNTTPTHVYLLTGIPDITQKIKGGSHHKPYTECIYTGNTRVTVSNIKDKLDQFEKAVKDKKAIPIFCTITNMNIQLYNEHLLKTHKTHTLHHTANYHKMQPLIDTIIYQVNYREKHCKQSQHTILPQCHTHQKGKQENTQQILLHRQLGWAFGRGTRHIRHKT